jgi:hypothetical protein
MGYSPIADGQSHACSSSLTALSKESPSVLFSIVSVILPRLRFGEAGSFVSALMKRGYVWVELFEKFFFFSLDLMVI